MRIQIFLKPSNDLGFKNLFGTDSNIEFTKELISSLLDYSPEKLEDIEISNSVKLDKETIENKHYELDILLKLKSGEKIILEMQTVYDIEAEIKSLVYAFWVASKNVKVGEKYKNMKKTTLIIFAKRMELRRGKRVIEQYGIMNKAKYKIELIPGLFEVIIIRLVEDNCEDLEKNIPESFKSMYNFLRSDTEEELYRVSLERKILIKMYKENKRFMNNEYVQNYLGLDEWARVAREARHIEEARTEAHEEGKTEGISQEKNYTARLMLTNNEPIDKIMKYTGLSKEKLMSLKEESIQYNE